MHVYHKQQHIQARTVDLTRDRQARKTHVHGLAELCPSFEKLEHCMEVLGYPKDDIFAVTQAAFEAVSNAFQHGNQSDLSKLIHFRYLVTRDEVLLEVEDQGPGFDPDRVVDPLVEENLDRPLGRGLFQMRAYMTWVQFNQTGNRVTLCKQRSSP
jgi:serine/threonine-protein kinase RsbW